MLMILKKLRVVIRLEKIIKKIEKYFDVTISGSYRFVEEKLLKFEDINDIDIFITNRNDYNRVFNFLKDEGYKSLTCMPIDIYGNVATSVILEKEKSKPFHLNFLNSKIFTTTNKIIQFKLFEIIDKNKMKHIKQLKIILNNLEKRINENKKN